jgi:hypothetical protein
VRRFLLYKFLLVCSGGYIKEDTMASNVAQMEKVKAAYRIMVEKLLRKKTVTLAEFL